MNIIKHSFLLSKFPKWNQKMVLKITCATLLSIFSLFLIIDFIRADLNYKYVFLRENIVVNAQNTSIEYDDLDIYLNNLEAKRNHLSKSLNISVEASIAFNSSIYLKKENEVSTRGFSVVYTDYIDEYISIVYQQKMNLLDQTNTNNGIFISKTLSNEWFGLNDATGEIVYIFNDLFGEEIALTQIKGVFEVTQTKSLLFDDPNDLALSLDYVVFGDLAVVEQINNVYTIGSIFIEEIYIMDQDIKTTDSNIILGILSNPNYKYLKINSLFDNLSPFFSLLNTLVVIFVMISLTTIISISVIRMRDIDDYYTILRVYFLKRTDLIFLSFISNFILLMRGFLISIGVYAVVYAIIYFITGYLILPSDVLIIIITTIMSVFMISGLILGLISILKPSRKLRRVDFI